MVLFRTLQLVDLGAMIACASAGHRKGKAIARGREVHFFSRALESLALDAREPQHEPPG